jgi:hypothetical protein
MQRFDSEGHTWFGPMMFDRMKWGSCPGNPAENEKAPTSGAWKRKLAHP